MKIAEMSLVQILIFDEKLVPLCLLEFSIVSRMFILVSFLYYAQSAFMSGHPNAVFCSHTCKNQYNVYKVEQRKKAVNSD